MRFLNQFARCAVLLGTLGSLSPAQAVYLNPDGTGQALIYPYYTARSSNGNPFNTYVSVTNQSPDTKALRVRFHEGRESREVASFNLFLSPGDVWTGAIVPADTGARLISSDRSCTSPSFTSSAGETPGIALVDNANTTGTREGWLEVLEMGVLLGSSATLVAHTAGGAPANCSGVQGTVFLDVGPPTGGISGTLTLINVSTGLDFTLNAEALAELSSRPFYRPAADPYPDLGAAEIDPISVVIANGSIYRSTWARAIDAVSASLMRSEWAAEYVLDSGTRSSTDFVVTFPTRQHYVFATAVQAPFADNCIGNEGLAGEYVLLQYFDREEGGALYNEGRGMLFRCRASAAFDVKNSLPQLISTSVLGSTNLAMASVILPASFANGWLKLTLPIARSLTSLPTSDRINIATGNTTTGAHVFTGLPMVGFWVRTFENGTLVCGSGACQGSYGGIFPLRFSRTITPAS